MTSGHRWGTLGGRPGWYHDSNPRILTEEVSFQLNLSEPDGEKALADKSGEFYLNKGIEYVLWYTCMMRFYKGWQPVVTEIDYAKSMISSFGQDKGKLVSIADVKKALLPYELSAAFDDFYIPPEATFDLFFKEIVKRKWCIINIESGKFCLNLEVTGNAAPPDVCYVRINYKKKGLLNYFFTDYVPYDKWFRLWIKDLNQIQEINIKRKQFKKFR